MRREKSSLLNALIWVIVGLLLALMVAWTVWAARQPDIHSLWAPD